MGKLLGAFFGYLIARLPGAIFGILIGHAFDKGYKASYTAYTHANSDANSDQQQQSNHNIPNELAEAYQLLDLEATVSDLEVKRTYRKLISQYHPDKMASKDLPKEMMILAKEKTQAISAAYEIIKKARGL